MGENTPTHDNMDENSPAPDENVKRKAQRGGESPELKRSRKESEESENSTDVEDEAENTSESEGDEEEREKSHDSTYGELIPPGKARHIAKLEAEKAALKKEIKKSGERKRRSRSKSVERKRSKSPAERRRSRSPARRRSPGRRSSPARRSPARRLSPAKRRSRSPAARKRSRSPEVKRRRDDREKDSRRDRSRERGSRNEESRKEHKSESEKRTDNGDIKEPKQPPKPKELTKRDLERLELLKKLEEEEALEDGPTRELKREEVSIVKVCPYLDTIDRTVLDFDFEKLCSVSLSTMNVYACMICGKYYQGRGISTHAYTHSLDTDHRVFLNLQTLKFYCLPDNYEIRDPSLEDIKYVLKPTYSKALIASLDLQTKMSRAYDDSAYFPGIVGLNNIKANDYCNVVLHAFSQVIPLRNYFLQEENYINLKRPPGDTLFELPKRFGELMRKLWNPRAFRKHVSPHEMLQAAVQCSGKKFQITEQSDAAEFMTFLLNTLHTALNGTQKTSSSIIYKTFRGRMRQYSRPIPPADCTEEQAQALLQLPAYKEVLREFPFLYLSMDLPPPPLYRDTQMENVIPQIPLQVLLNKFNGSTEKEYKTYKDNIMKRFEILRLPEYLVVTYKRFTKNQFFMEKNPTIVNFPITNVDMYECLAPEARTEHKYTTYDLIANIVHDGTPDEGTYRAQVLHQGSGKWFQMEDLHVEEILPQVIVLAEAYIQVWRLNKKLTRDQRINEEESEGIESIPGLAMSNPFNIQPLPKVKPADVENK